MKELHKDLKKAYHESCQEKASGEKTQKLSSQLLTGFNASGKKKKWAENVGIPTAMEGK